MTKSSATSQIEGKNKTIDYKKLYQEQAKKASADAFSDFPRNP